MVEIKNQEKCSEMISPCRNNCQVNWELRYCQGCRRTLQEIEVWRDITDQARRDIIKHTKKRNDEYFRNQCRIS